jgi:hypothetical protein
MMFVKNAGVRIGGNGLLPALANRIDTVGRVVENEQTHILNANGKAKVNTPSVNG